MQKKKNCYRIPAVIFFLSNNLNLIYFHFNEGFNVVNKFFFYCFYLKSLCCNIVSELSDKRAL